MKNLLSVVLALLMLFSIAAFASAEGPEGMQGLQEPFDGMPHDGEVPFPPGEQPQGEHMVGPDDVFGPHQPMPPGWEQGKKLDYKKLKLPPPMPPENQEGPVPPVWEEGQGNKPLPGITPDHKFLWNLELALERLEIAMTFTDSEKAKKKLEHAMERIVEAKQMAEQKMFDDALQAQKEHDEIIRDLENILKKLKGETGPEELDDLKDFEEELEDHEDLVEEFKDESLGWKEKLTPEQKQKLEELLSQFGASVEDIEIKLNAKKDRVLIKIKLAEKEGDREGPEGWHPEEPLPEGMPHDEMPGDGEPKFLEEPEWID